MSDFNYVKADWPGAPFPVEFIDGRQFWKRPFKTTNQTNDQIAAIVDSGMISIEQDVPILAALLNLNMLTFDMLCKLFPDRTPEDIQNSLSKLYNLKFINEFLIASEKRDANMKFPADGYVIYTLDADGRQVLIQYGDPASFPTRWERANICMGVPKITIQLIISSLFIELKRICKQNLKYFEPARYLRFNGGTARMAAEFAVNHKGVDKYFFAVVADENGLIPAFRDTMDGVIGYLSSKACYAHFAPEIDPKPVVLVLAENEEVALEAGRIIEQKCAAYEVPSNFRYTTCAALARDISEGKTFMKFVPADKDTKTEAHMQYVKSAVFTDTVWDASVEMSDVTGN